MKTKLGILTLLAGLLLLNCNPQEQKKISEKKDPQWESLFNQENLEGWLVKIKGYELGDNYAQTFRVTDGLLQVNYEAYESYDSRFGALYYHKPFSNYRLKVEYRFIGDTVKGAPSWGYRDSGIQYHCQDPKSMGKDQNFPVSLEYNLHGGNGIDERPLGQVCANGVQIDISGKPNETYCTVPTISKTFHGDQWVTAEIEVKGNTISHWANGEKILEFQNPRLNPEHELAKSIMKGENASHNSGYISFQSNSAPIEFRTIDILVLP